MKIYKKTTKWFICVVGKFKISLKSDPTLTAVHKQFVSYFQLNVTLAQEDSIVNVKPREPVTGILGFGWALGHMLNKHKKIQS